MCTWDDWIGIVEYKIKWHYHQKPKQKKDHIAKNIFNKVLGVWSEFFKKLE